MEDRLKEELMYIKPVNMEVYNECKERWNAIAKPLNSLGLLEDMICKIGAIRENSDVTIKKKCAVIMCADNGVIREGISQSDETVTAVVAKNLADGRANVNHMGSISSTKIIPVNIGMVGDFSYPGVMDVCVRKGTGNIAVESAMTREECATAILTGIELVKKLKLEGYDLIATGEMGIGNTTTSSALASILLDEPVENVTGKGAGLSDDGLIRKIEVIKRALKLHQPNPQDPVDMIAKVGGLDIAGMVGLYLGGAIAGVPVIVDGLISSVAANLAVLLKKEIADYILASHVGKEPACRKLLERIALEPVICAQMALGEGTGAVALFPMLEMAHRVYTQNVTFSKINMEPYRPL